MNDNNDDVRGRVDALVSVGRPAEARATARTALETAGTDAGLFLALARAHVAEDDDDHDDAAERVFREGLDTFPHDIGLLAGYAELCARTDALDRPGRHARGPVLLARLRELAPHSPELLRAETAGSSVSVNDKNSASVRRVQSFDAARAFASAPTPQAAAAQAAQWAAVAPHVLRLAVLAETTAVLAAAGRTWPRLLLRRGLEYRLATGVVVAALIVLRLTVLPALPYGVAAGAGLLLGLPFISLRRQLRTARERAAERMAATVTEAESGDEAGVGADGVEAPELPPVPRVTPREYIFAGAGLALLLGIGVTAYASSLTYPRYDIVAHDTFRGLQGFDLREEFDPFGAVPDSEKEGSTARVYVAEDAAPDAAAEYLVAVTTGDFHEMRESYVYDGGPVPKETERVGIVHDTWRAGAGPHGSWMQCRRYTEVATGTLRAMCVWGDKGSIGMVLFTAADKNRDAVEDTARSVGADFLRPAGD
ncbi:hypothetical protein [Streptomyces sp. NBC_00572]|uniref:hypothetical protein n=1 Tax=Streptomyces sp. NBC_00572 TaxID=2903664 RepID=UPI0022529748|nr:hypothetical protein [Streptomyces sp. NBC_00572]MCX4985961.1 hypothetical protein [Streptomyces sp. NBC_00572]